MITETQQHPDTGAIHAQIEILDRNITKLVKWFNASSYRNGSLMISGRDSLGKEFHELVVFDSSLPMPLDRIKPFINDYCQDLIARRAILLQAIEPVKNDQEVSTASDQQPIGEIYRILDREIHHCSHCSKPTPHSLHQAGTIVTWYCDYCSNVNPNAEID